MSNEFKEGQVLIFDPSDGRREPREITIGKTGRRWVQIKSAGWIDARFDKETLVIDGRGYASPGRVWLSWDSYHGEKRRLALHARLRRMLDDYSKPYTTEQVAAALAALGYTEQSE
ncbi:hypothetical protein NAV33_07520 [Pseudomonas stutzeri]|uniref:beta barrel domain-containing protein n=1 Tax=Stutzerimonas stutzeri TaxID=316 RepID=UPI00210E0BD2|nr:hypothetical protein [Stutzerimonas stutzeri]MCQ4311744.1 hypothetical protein [Stutzerimonas stutzeri]